jgi:hypothetical protein
VADRVVVGGPKSPAKSKLFRVAVLREGEGLDHRSRVPTQRHFLDTGGMPRVWHRDCVNGLGEQDNGRADGQQNSVARRLLRRRLHAAGPTVREARAPSSAGYGCVFDRDSAAIARGLGGCWVIAELDLSTSAYFGPSAAFSIMRPARI